MTIKINNCWQTAYYSRTDLRKSFDYLGEQVCTAFGKRIHEKNRCMLKGRMTVFHRLNYTAIRSSQDPGRVR